MSADFEKARLAERQNLSLDERKVAALEQIADELARIRSDTLNIKGLLSAKGMGSSYGGQQ